MKPMNRKSDHQPISEKYSFNSFAGKMSVVDMFFGDVSVCLIFRGYEIFYL